MWILNRFATSGLGGGNASICDIEEVLEILRSFKPLKVRL